jgi:hypothetical protein
MATAPRATCANLIADSFTRANAHRCLALSPAERAAVAAELARLRARVANLAARLDRVQATLAAPETQIVTTAITRVSGVRVGRRAAAGVVTDSGARPCR